MWAVIKINKNYLSFLKKEFKDKIGNDVLIVISTSGKSRNILEVLKIARKKKIYSIGFLGKNGGEAKKFTDLSLVIKGSSVARIQEAHILLGHYIFEHVEKKFVQ